MKIKLDDLDIYFPFKYIYPEQYEYLLALKTIFAKPKTNATIQIPPAISMSSCLFAFYVSNFLKNSTIPRLVFSAKSISVLENVMQSLKLVINYIEKEHNIQVPLLALSISEKKNLCINEAVCKKQTREAINYECNKRIAPWVRQGKSKKSNENGNMEIEDVPELCEYYENYIFRSNNIPKLTGCYSFEELRNYGKVNNLCPYYLSEEVYGTAQIILCDYFMLFGMKKNNNYDRKVLDGAFLIIDECCGLDEQIAEMFTERITRISLDHSLKCVEDLNNQIKNIKNPKQYEEEFQNLVKGLTKDDLDINQINKREEAFIDSYNDDDMGGTEEKKIKFPGYIRKAEHFITHLKKFILFLKGSITKSTSKVISHGDYLERYLKETLIDPSRLPLSYFPARLRALINQLQNAEIESEHYLPLHALVQFAQLFGRFAKGFEVILSTIQETNLDVSEISLMVLSLVCLDPAEPFSQITSNIGSILFHSETLVEVETFAKIMELDDHPNNGSVDAYAVNLTTKLKVFPMIVSKGADQIELSTEHSRKHDAGVMRNYANMIMRLSEAVPDGIVCMFPNSRTLKDIGLDYYDEILEKKLIFAELPDVHETSKSVSGYKLACENGRGGVFMGLMRGKVLGNIPLDNRCARCIVVFGVPLEYSRPREFLARTRYFKAQKSIQENDYIIYSVMKEVCKGLAKVIKKRDDACVIIFADKRFLQADKISRLPEWIQKSLENINKGLPSDQAAYRAVRFYKSSEYDKDWKKYSEDDFDKLRDLFKNRMRLD